MHLFNMKNWILSIGAVIILTSILTLILPNSKLGKNIKSIFSLMIVLIILQPIVKLKDGRMNFDKINTEQAIILQDDFIHYIAEQKITNYEHKCQNFLIEKGINNAKTSIDYIVNTNGQVEIILVNVDLTNSVINSDLEHIDITEVICYEFSKILNVDKNKVKING